MTVTPPDPPVEQSILSLTKKALGLAPDYNFFDPDIIMHINSVFADLTQLGVGPNTGYEIVDDAALWSDYLAGNKQLNAVKSYMYLRVRLLFDPPDVGFSLTAIKEQIDKAEWRLNVAVETPADLVVVETDPYDPYPYDPSCT